MCVWIVTFKEVPAGKQINKGNGQGGPDKRHITGIENSQISSNDADEEDYGSGEGEGSVEFHVEKLLFLLRIVDCGLRIFALKLVKSLLGNHFIIFLLPGYFCMVLFLVSDIITDIMQL